MKYNSYYPRKGGENFYKQNWNMKNFTNSNISKASASSIERKWSQKEPLAFSQLVEDRVEAINDMISRNGGRSLISVLLRALDACCYHWTRSKVRLVCYFAFHVHAIIQKQGIKGAVLRLKSAQVLLQQGSAGYRVHNISELKVRVNRTRAGLPRMIPAIQRELIRKGDVNTIRFWMTLLGLYRVLSYKGKLSLNTITDPGADTASWSFNIVIGNKWREFVKNSFWPVLKKRGWINEMSNMTLSPSPVSIERSSPSSGLHKWRLVSTSFPALVASAKNIIADVKWRMRFHEWLSTVTNGQAYWTRIQWCARRGYEIVGRIVSREDLYQTSEHDYELYGKLGTKEEAAGKIRVFAMVDAWTQWVLRPIHLAIFSCLKYIPQDGTFDQERPIELLLIKLKERVKYLGEATPLYSIDLSAATDRLPIGLQVTIMEEIISTMENGKYTSVAVKLAQLWRDLLVDRTYRLKMVEEANELIWPRMNEIKLSSGATLARVQGFGHKLKKITKIYHLRYSVGQPMGALSSWAMLAITHHAIVQFAHWLDCKEKGRQWKWFTLYAVLGDDVVIATKEVALQYQRILLYIQVKAGMAKSIVALTSITLEFAKKFWVNGVRADMIPIKESITTRLTTSLASVYAAKYSMSWVQVMNFYGYGYKVKGGRNKLIWDLPLRVRVLYVWLTAPAQAWSTGEDDEQQLLNWLSIKTPMTQWSYGEIPWGRIAECMLIDLEALEKRYRESIIRVEKKLESNPFGMDEIPEGDEVLRSLHLEEETLQEIRALRTEPRSDWALSNESYKDVLLPIGDDKYGASLNPMFTQKDVKTGSDARRRYMDTTRFGPNVPKELQVLDPNARWLDIRDTVGRRGSGPMYHHFKGLKGNEFWAIRDAMASTYLYGEYRGFLDPNEDGKDQVLFLWSRFKKLEKAMTDLVSPSNEFRREEPAYKEVIGMFKRWVHWTSPIKQYHAALAEERRSLNDMRLKGMLNLVVITPNTKEHINVDANVAGAADMNDRFANNPFKDMFKDFVSPSKYPLGKPNIGNDASSKRSESTSVVKRVKGFENFFSYNPWHCLHSSSIRLLWMRWNWKAIVLKTDIQIAWCVVETSLMLTLLMVVMFMFRGCYSPDNTDTWYAENESIGTDGDGDYGMRPTWKDWAIAGTTLVAFGLLCSLISYGIDSYNLAANLADPAIRPLILPHEQGVGPAIVSASVIAREAEEVMERVIEIPSTPELLRLVWPASPMQMHGFWE